MTLNLSWPVRGNPGRYETVQESRVLGSGQVGSLSVSDGRSIRLFLADGTPGGLLTAEIMNWTGHVVAAPRSDLAVLLRWPETSRTGIYILLGDDPESFGGTLAYIGEGDEVRTRLKQHARADEQGGKDFRDRAVMLTSKDANLTNLTRQENAATSWASATPVRPAAPAGTAGAEPAGG
jgi:hypothetical protein